MFAREIWIERRLMESNENSAVTKADERRHTVRATGMFERNLSRALGGAESKAIFTDYTL